MFTCHVASISSNLEQLFSLSLGTTTGILKCAGGSFCRMSLLVPHTQVPVPMTPLGRTIS